MVSSPVKRDASLSSLSTDAPPSPGPAPRPRKAGVGNYFQIHPPSASPSPVTSPPLASSSGYSFKSLGKSGEGKDSGRKRSGTSSRSSSGLRGKEVEPDREGRSSSSTKSKRSSGSRTIVPPPRTSSVGSFSSPPTTPNLHFIPPRSSSRGDLSIFPNDTFPASASPSPSSSPRLDRRTSSSPTPVASVPPPSSYPSRPSAKPSRAHLPEDSTASSSSSRHRPPPTLHLSVNQLTSSLLTNPAKSPTSHSSGELETRRHSGRMSIPREAPAYSSRSVGSDAMDAMVDSMNAGSRPTSGQRARASISTRKNSGPAIRTEESSASEDDVQRETVARPRPSRSPKPSHFRNEMDKERVQGQDQERVAAWVDKEQADLDRRRRREGLPSLASPVASSSPHPRRSQTFPINPAPSSTNAYLSPDVSPSRGSSVPLRASSYSEVEQQTHRRDLDLVAPPPPSPRTPDHIPTIDEIIKSNLAREAASRGNRTHPLPSAFAPPISPTNKRGGDLYAAGVSATPSEDFSRRRRTEVPSLPSSEGEAAGRSSVDSVAEEASFLRDGRDRAFGWPISRNLLNPPPSASSSTTPTPAIQFSNSLPIPRARPNSTAFERSLSSLVNGSLYANDSSGPRSPTRKSSTSSVRSASTTSTAQVVSQISSESSSPIVPRASSPYSSKDPNHDHAILLRSSRLTRLLILARHPNRGLVVSLSDVGSSTGHPVIVYLGLGGVRYLTALFDELAESMGLRLICIDRWGLGKTGEVPPERRGFLEWAAVVDEVADQLGVSKFSILAHSAGAPYSLATALRLPERVFGSVHLLAPWVSVEIDGGYKWLKYVPTGVIKATQAAEWRMQGWRMGKVPTLALEPVGYTVPLTSPPSSTVNQQTSSITSSLSSHLDSPSSPTFTPNVLISEESYDDLADFGGKYPNGRDYQQEGSLRRKTSKIFSSNGGGSLRGSPSLRHSTSNGSLPQFTPIPATDYPSLTSKPLPLQPSTPSSTSSPRPSVSKHSSSPRPASPNTQQPGRIDLGTALLRASHAENQRGTADLLAIMEKSGEWGFSYTDVQAPVKVWWGDRDERIGEKGIRWMERAMPNCTVKTIKGEGHNLLSSTRVVVEVLESIAKEVGVY